MDIIQKYKNIRLFFICILISSINSIKLTDEFTLRRQDCLSGGDEKVSDCQKLSNTSCLRRASISDLVPLSLNIPTKWVADGVVDCSDGRDEDVS